MRLSQHQHELTAAVALLAAAAAFSVSLTSCTGALGLGQLPEAPILSEKDRLCSPTAGPATERRWNGGSTTRSGSFQAIRESLTSTCRNCHQAPSALGDFTYIDEYKGRETSIDGITRYFPGYFDVAERMSAALLAERMPPLELRSHNPEAFLRIGEDLKSWINAGKPDGSFNSDGNFAPVTERQPAGDLGECVPVPEAVGTDFRKDRFFASLEKLPVDLRETDLFTLDALELARKGTLAYTVEYPLWADNNGKGRWVHVPAKLDAGRALRRQSIHYDPSVKTFAIPENTRFYKTFYKPVLESSGRRRFRRVETRLIVVRYPSEKALFGTYRWDEQEQNASLVQTPYRDGSSWKDSRFDLVVDEKKGKTRSYVIPARHRCVECHLGAESFVLGFTPLQLNRREKGAGGRTETTTPQELTQAERLLAAGVTDGYGHSEELPKLEWMGSRNPRNIHEVRAQGYFVGNCTHCHNPSGFAMKNGVKLDLSAGEIYEFNTRLRSIHFPATQERRFVDSQGDLDKSYVFTKVSAPPSEQGMFAQMPLHTAGSPDCKGLELVGRWVKTWESIRSAETWQPECKARDDSPWVDQDFTWPVSETYAPRRPDWKTGMPDSMKELRLDEGLQKISGRSYAVGYWNRKPECRFPDVNPEPAQVRPWMLGAQGKLKRPFGEVYTSRPGAWFFTTTCVKCHGPRGDGNSTFANALLTWSGGSVRVANLIDGMFGKSGANLSTFDEGGRSLAGNYLLWMATEGTRVQFPAEASNYLGKHKAQMLNLFREKCATHIATAQQLARPLFQDFEIFREICFHENLSPDHPSIQFDPATGRPVDPPALERWMDRAALNAGWAIFDYLSGAARGAWWPTNDACEKIYPRH